MGREGGLEAVYLSRGYADTDRITAVAGQGVCALLSGCRWAAATFVKKQGMRGARTLLCAFDNRLRSRVWLARESCGRESRGFAAMG